MSPEQIKLVKRTWRILMHIDARILGCTFFSKLFADHPDLRKYFPKDMNGQYNHLVEAISSAIIGLDRQDGIQHISLFSIPENHTEYDKKRVSNTMTANAFFWTLKNGLGTEWNTETENAWRNCWYILTEKALQRM